MLQLLKVGKKLDHNQHPDAFDLASLDFDEELGGEDFSSDQSVSAFGSPFGEPIEQRTQPTPPTSHDDPFAHTAPPSSADDSFEDHDLDDISEFELSSNIFGSPGEHDDLADDFFMDAANDETNMTFVMPPSEGFEETAYHPPAHEFDHDLADQEIGTFAYGSQGTTAPFNSSYPVFEDETLLTPPGESENTYTNDRNDLGYISGESASTAFNHDDDQGFDLPYDQNGFSGHEDFSFDNFDETFGSETFAMEDVAAHDSSNSYTSGLDASQSSRDGFLDEFDVFGDDLGSIPDFSLEDSSALLHGTEHETIQRA